MIGIVVNHINRAFFYGYAVAGFAEGMTYVLYNDSFPLLMATAAAAAPSHDSFLYFCEPQALDTLGYTIGRNS